MRVSFRTKLLGSHLVVALTVSTITLFVVERVVREQLQSETDNRLESQAKAAASWVEQSNHPQRLAPRLAGIVGARVTVIDPFGIAVGESAAPANQPAGMDSEGAPREVELARQRGLGKDTRYSAEANQRVRYVAVPAGEKHVLRLGLPLGTIDETNHEVRNQILTIALGSLPFALALAAIVAGSLTRRMRAATTVAQRVGNGDYDDLQLPSSDDEIGVLSSAIVTSANQLRDTDRKRREFLATIAHEIRTPVTSIQGYAQTLNHSQVTDDERAEFLQTIERNAKRIAALVQDILELETLQSAATHSVGVVDIRALVQNVVSTVAGQANAAGVTVDVQVSEQMVHSSSEAVERILLNLLDNAIRHGGDRIVVKAVDSDTKLVIAVSDNGLGLSSTQRTKVFERFYRSTPGRQGNGLGLAICKELANAIGAEVYATDDEDLSIAFCLEIPK